MPAVTGADSEAERVRRIRRWRRLLPPLAAMMAILAVEIGVRASEAWQESRTLQAPEELRGWGLRPGFRGWSNTEAPVRVEINRDGMRDRDHEIAKAAGTVRLAVLGDSYMQGVNVPVEKTFASYLERRLAGCAQRLSRRADVLNFGVGGYGTAQEFLTFRHHASRYQPDIVLLAVYTGNDIFNNHRALNEQNEMPYFVLRNHRLELEERPVEVPAAAAVPWYQAARLSITSRSVAARLAWDGYALLRAPFVAPQLVDVMPRDTSATEWARALYHPLPTRVVGEAWAVTEALISALASEVAQHGAEFWLVTLSNNEQVDPNVGRRRGLANQLGVDDLFYPDRRLRAFATAQGIPVVSLAEPLAAYTAEHGVYLNGGYNEDFPNGVGHWNETANELAAGLVGERLCAESAGLSGRP